VRRVGILVSSDAVRALVVRSGRVTWHAHAAIGEKERAGPALERVLSNLPRARIGRTTVRVAFGLAHSDVKRIEGLPRARHPKILNRLVKENADAFFLRLGARTLVADVALRSDESTWAAAFDAPLVDEVLGTLRGRRLAAAGVMSFAEAVSHAVPSGTWCVRDGGVALELTTIEGPVIESRRRGLGQVDTPDVRVAALDALGPDGSELIAPFGAAVAPTRALFKWRPAPDPARARTLNAARVAAASLLLILSAGAALFARGVHADRLATAATNELATFHLSAAASARVDAELRRTTAELDRVHQFAATRGRTIALLAALSEALPDSTALVSLRVDTLEGNVVVLAPHAATVLPALFDVPGIFVPRIVGSVTREVQGTARVERASIRFRRRSNIPVAASRPASRQPASAP
jgi:hypothetical protein